MLISTSKGCKYLLSWAILTNTGERHAVLLLYLLRTPADASHMTLLTVMLISTSKAVSTFCHGCRIVMISDGCGMWWCLFSQDLQTCHTSFSGLWWLTLSSKGVSIPFVMDLDQTKTPVNTLWHQKSSPLNRCASLSSIKVCKLPLSWILIIMTNTAAWVG